MKRCISLFLWFVVFDLTMIFDAYGKEGNHMYFDHEIFAFMRIGANDVQFPAYITEIVEMKGMYRVKASTPTNYDSNGMPVYQEGWMGLVDCRTHSAYMYDPGSRDKYGNKYPAKYSTIPGKGTFLGKTVLYITKACQLVKNYQGEI